jgi:hypothetical protein
LACGAFGTEGVEAFGAFGVLGAFALAGSSGVAGLATLAFGTHVGVAGARTESLACWTAEDALDWPDRRSAPGWETAAQVTPPTVTAPAADAAMAATFSENMMYPFCPIGLLRPSSTRDPGGGLHGIPEFFRAARGPGVEGA